jgi:5-methylcytosine-specific restriction endonuclease McrA
VRHGHLRQPGQGPRLPSAGAPALRPFRPSHRIRRDALVIALADRDGDRCWYCGCAFDDGEGGGSRALTLDHVHPVADGGASSLDNLRLCCRTCNQRKGQLGSEAYDASELLARRRRQMYREELRKLGVRPQA